MNEMLRFGTSVYGDRIVLGANWNLFWWFVGAAVAFMIIHVVSAPILHRRRVRVGEHPREN